MEIVQTASELKQASDTKNVEVSSKKDDDLKSLQSEKRIQEKKSKDAQVQDTASKSAHDKSKTNES